MSSYDKVAKVVAPKKQALEAAEGEYQAVMAGLRRKQEELAELMGQLAKLEDQLNSSMAEKKRLEHEVRARGAAAGVNEQVWETFSTPSLDPCAPAPLLAFAQRWINARSSWTAPRSSSAGSAARRRGGPTAPRS